MTSIAPQIVHHPIATDSAVLRPRIALAERTADCLVGLLAAALETVALIVVWRSGLGSLAAVVAVHGLIVALLWRWLVYRAARATDVSGPQLLLLAAGATGPIGAVVAALSAFAPTPSVDDQALLDAWYDRISQASGVDQITQMADGIAIGRTIDLAKPSGPSFVDVMRGTDIKAQQTVLGLIARTFRPDYVPALVLALKNREPIIRVQAAAVATRIRPSLVAVVATAARASGPLATGDAAREGARLVARHHVELALASGLLDSADEATARDVIRALDACVADPVMRFDLRGRSVRATSAIAHLAPAVRTEIEVRLVADRKFSDLRRVRSITRLGAGRLYRVRSLPRPTPGTAKKSAGEAS